MDRASLVRRRQLIREKENVGANTAVDGSTTAFVKNRKMTKRSTANDNLLSETTSVKARSELGSQNSAILLAPPPVPEKRAARCSKQRKSASAKAPGHTSELNAGLVSMTKMELFQQALVVATYVQDVKMKHAEVLEDMEAELVQYQSKYCTAMSERERICEEQEKEKRELLDQLKLAQDEYQSLIVWIREDKVQAQEKTQHDHSQLIEEMSDIRRQREQQVNAMATEREEVFRFVEKIQEQNFKLQHQVVVMERDCKRLKTDLKEEQGENKKLLFEIQQKAQTLDQISSELEDTKTQVSTLQGQVQLEAISRQSITQERNRLQQQYQVDREYWKSTNVHREALEKKKTEEFRKMDLELRHVKQTLSRLRIEWESEKTRSEKAEIRLQELSTFLDETKVHTKAAEEDVQQLKTQLNEEKEVRISKDHALQIAHRDLQAIQKNNRELENAKLDAQREVVSLIQRMKVIRRNHLALLHRVEAPAQLAAEWL